jgi:hypothetical protein
MSLSITFSLYDLEYLGPFLAMGLFFVYGLLQLQKPHYCKMWHKQYWVRSKMIDVYGEYEETVCRKCGHHFIK